MMGRAENVTSYRLDLQTAYTIWDTACGPYGGHDEFCFAPSMAIDRYNGTHKRKLVREELPNWMAFENSQVEWDHRDFERMILGPFNADADIFLITDEGLMEHSVFGFSRARFDDFVGWYKKEYKMEFFQPADYIVFDRGLESLSVLHHEGLLFSVCTRAEQREGAATG